MDGVLRKGKVIGALVTLCASPYPTPIPQGFAGGTRAGRWGLSHFPGLFEALHALSGYSLRSPATLDTLDARKPAISLYLSKESKLSRLNI
jgi:hypothetical protein